MKKMKQKYPTLLACVLIIFTAFTLTVSTAAIAQETASGGSGGGGSFILSASAGGYKTQDDTDNTVNHDTIVRLSEGTLGYVFSSGIYIGGIYGQASTEEKGVATKPETVFSGATFGYFSKGGFIFQGHFISSAEIKKATATTQWNDGTGTQFDIGFIKNLYGPIFVGGQISTRTINYTTLVTSGVKSKSKHSVAETFPELKISIVW